MPIQPRLAPAERRRLLRTTGLAVMLLAGLAWMSGCQTNAQSGALIGAGLGVLAGQAIGGDTEATLIGGALGAGTGYVIGNEFDKDQQEHRQLDDEAYYSERHGIHRPTRRTSSARY